MSIEQLVTFVQQGGGIAAVLLLLALIWMSKDRQRLIEENKQKDEELKQLAIQVITISTELKLFLFNERKT